MIVHCIFEFLSALVRYWLAQTKKLKSLGIYICVFHNFVFLKVTIFAHVIKK